MLKKMIKLNENLDALISVAHDAYMSTTEDDIENRARLDAQIKAYWKVKNMVEDIIRL